MNSSNETRTELEGQYKAYGEYMRIIRESHTGEEVKTDELTAK